MSLSMHVSACSIMLVEGIVVRFNALRRALWEVNDRSHGTNPDC